MHSYSEYRKNRLIENMGKNSPKESLQSLFEVLKIDLKSAVNLPETISENIGFNADYLMARQADQKFQEFVIDHLCNHGKLHFYEMILEDAEDVHVSTMALHDVGNMLDMLKADLKKRVDQIVNTDPDSLRSILKKSMSNVVDADAIEDEPATAKPTATRPASTGPATGPASTGPATRPASTGPATGPASTAGSTSGTPSPVSNGHGPLPTRMPPVIPQDSPEQIQDLKPLRRPRGPVDGNFQPADYGRIRPKDGFWKGIRRAVVDPMMQWNPVKKFRRRWHGDPTREHLELFERSILLREDYVDKVISGFTKKLNTWIDTSIDSIAANKGIPVTKAPVPVKSPDLAPDSDLVSPLTQDTQEEEPATSILGMNDDDLEQYYDAKRGMGRRNKLKQRRKSAGRFLGTDISRTDAGRAAHSKTWPQVVKAIAAKAESGELKLPEGLSAKITALADASNMAKRKFWKSRISRENLNVSPTSNKEFLDELLHVVARHMTPEQHAASGDSTGQPQAQAEKLPTSGSSRVEWMKSQDLFDALVELMKSRGLPDKEETLVPFLDKANDETFKFFVDQAKRHVGIDVPEAPAKPAAVAAAPVAAPKGDQNQLKIAPHDIKEPEIPAPILGKPTQPMSPAAKIDPNPLKVASSEIEPELEPEAEPPEDKVVLPGGVHSWSELGDIADEDWDSGKEGSNSIQSLIKMAGDWELKHDDFKSWKDLGDQIDKLEAGEEDEIISDEDDEESVDAQPEAPAAEDFPKPKLDSKADYEKMKEIEAELGSHDKAAKFQDANSVMDDWQRFKRGAGTEDDLKSSLGEYIRNHRSGASKHLKELEGLFGDRLKQWFVKEFYNEILDMSRDNPEGEKAAAEKGREEAELQKKRQADDLAKEREVRSKIRDDEIEQRYLSPTVGDKKPSVSSGLSKFIPRRVSEAVKNFRERLSI